MTTSTQQSPSTAAALLFRWFKTPQALPCLCFGVAVLVAVALRFYRLEGESFWFDEIHTTWQTYTTWKEVWARLQNDAHPPLYFVLLKLWIKVFGPGDFAVRAFSVVLGVLGVIALGAAGWRLVGPAGGVLAASLASVLPPLVQYSQEARMYALLILFLSLAVTGAVFWHKGRSRRDGCLYALSMAAALCTQYYTLFAWCGIGVLYTAYLLWQRRLDLLRRWLAWNLVPFAAFVLLLPLLKQQLSVHIDNFWLFSRPKPGELALPSFVAECFGIYVDGSGIRFGWSSMHPLMPLIFLGIGLAWAAVILRTRPAPISRPEGAQVDVDGGWLAILVGASVVPVLLIWAYSQHRNIWLFRSLLVSAPGWIYLSVVLLTRVRPPKLALLITALLLATSMAASVKLLNTPRKEQWREVAAYLRQEWQANDAVAVSLRWTRICLPHYGINFQDVLALPPHLSQHAGSEAELRALDHKASRIWLVLNRAPGATLGDYLVRECRRKRTRTVQFLNIEVGLYERDPAVRAAAASGRQAP
jgi:mannosyltransferase